MLVIILLIVACILFVLSIIPPLERIALKLIACGLILWVLSVLIPLLEAKVK